MVAALNLQMHINCAYKTGDYSKGSVLLYRYTELFKEKKCTYLYFPAHLGGNHWVPFFIDFKTRAGYEIESELYDTAAQSAAPVWYDITVWYSMIGPPQAQKNTVLYHIILYYTDQNFMYYMYYTYQNIQWMVEL